MNYNPDIPVRVTLKVEDLRPGGETFAAQRSLSSERLKKLTDLAEALAYLNETFNGVARDVLMLVEQDEIHPENHGQRTLFHP